MNETKVVPVEPTEAEFEIMAKALRGNTEARKCFGWLWNNADSEWIQSSYFRRFIRACHEAVLLAASPTPQERRVGQRRDRQKVSTPQLGRRYHFDRRVAAPNAAGQVQDTAASQSAHPESVRPEPVPAAPEPAPSKESKLVLEVATSVIDTCDQGHKFAKLPDHPRRDGLARCPHCMAIGLDAATAERDAAHNELSLFRSNASLEAQRLVDTALAAGKEKAE